MQQSRRLASTLGRSGRPVQAGVSVDRAGRRITGVVPGVPDHGQHDAVRDVLAVSCTGMLVRASAW
ncbi:hypothetical protein E0504_27215, partial [Parafrankia sp. BMG5.11]